MPDSPNVVETSCPCFNPDETYTIQTRRPAGAPKSFEQALSEHGGDLADVLLEMLDPLADSPQTRAYCAAFHAGRPTLIPALFGVVQSAAYAAPPMRLIITLSTEVDLSARLASDADGGYLDVRLVDFPD